MKYPEHINVFWRLRRADGSLTNTDFALYSYLCDCLNSDYWVTDRVTQRRDLICGFLGIGVETLEESRNRLKQKGLIDFITHTRINKNGKKQGVKGSSTTYIVLNGSQTSSMVGSSVPDSAPNSVLSGTPNRHYLDTKPTPNLTVLKIETEKEKEIVSVAHTHSLEEKILQMEQDLKALREEKKKKRPSPRSASPPSNQLELQEFPRPESWEEVAAYFTEKTSVNGKDAEKFARRFISKNTSDHWLNKHGLPISDWKSWCDYWIENEFSLQQKPSSVLVQAPAVHKTSPTYSQGPASEEARNQYRQLIESECLTEKERREQLHWCSRGDVTEKHLAESAAWWRKKIAERKINTS